MPDPIHPALVHFPIVLAAFAPVVAAGALVAQRLGFRARSVWSVVLVMHVVLVVSGWLAFESGEREEERVEAVVAEGHIHAHEEAAERFLLLAGLTLPITALGFGLGRVGGVARVAALGALFVVFVSGARAGQLGGELVYRHGAAVAWTDAGVDGAGHEIRTEYEDHAEDDD